MNRFYNFARDVTAPEDGVLTIEGEIVTDPGWWTDDGLVVARDVRANLSQYRNVTVYLNSPGGDVLAGAELYTALREHHENGMGDVTVIITGIAASAASVVAMGGSRVMISPAAYMMIHNPWSMEAGDAEQFRRTADVLDELAAGIAMAYHLRTGKPMDEIRAMMDSETWMSAQTCVDEGFADAILFGGAAPAQSAIGGRTAACLMQRSSHSRAAAMALINSHKPTPAASAPAASGNEDTAKRDEIAKRARLLLDSMAAG